MKPWKLLQTYEWVPMVGSFAEVRSISEALEEVKEYCGGKIPRGTLVIKVWDAEEEDHFYLPLVPKRRR